MEPLNKLWSTRYVLGLPSSAGVSIPLLGEPAVWWAERPQAVRQGCGVRGAVRFCEQTQRRVRASGAGAWTPEAERGGAASAGVEGGAGTPGNAEGACARGERSGGRLLPVRRGGRGIPRCRVLPRGPVLKGSWEGGAGQARAPLPAAVLWGSACGGLLALPQLGRAAAGVWMGRASRQRHALPRM